MTDTLLNAVRRYIKTCANPRGFEYSLVPSLTAISAAEPSGLVHAVTKPLVCLVLQGTKQVAMGTEMFTLNAGDSLLITADVPTISQITQASSDTPYISLVLDLDPKVIAELILQMKAIPAAVGGPVRSEVTDRGVTEAALRLMGLLDHPDAVPVLHTQLIRELHYWLLAGRHGPAIRRLGGPGGNAQRIAQAVALLRAEFTQQLRTERLAEIAGMSVSSFHQHFRTVTSLSPLQFQKQLRLIEARRLMMAQGVSASSAAFSVGYESVSQFTREYARMFGLPPIKDTVAIKSWTHAKAEDGQAVVS